MRPVACFLVVAGAVVASSCFVDRSAVGPDAASARMDGGGRAADASEDAPSRVDGGPCVSADGTPDPRIGTECDGEDVGACVDGTWECVGDSVVCVEDVGGNPDLCDGRNDEDCDPTTEDGSDEEWLGRGCDAGESEGGDTDLCEEGVWVCELGEMRCNEAPEDDVEVCDGIDNDCNGVIDDRPGGCPCKHRTYEGRDYLFCTDDATWAGARDGCPPGFDLVVITSEPEQQFVQMEAHALRNADWWIGAQRDMTTGSTEVVFRWVDRTEVPLPDNSGFQNWRPPDRPNGGGNCLIMDSDRMGTVTVGSWDDVNCSSTHPYVCESTSP